MLNITNRDRTQVFPTYEVFFRICSARPTHNPALLSLSFFMTYHMIFNRSNKTGPTSGAGIAYPIPIFSGGRVAQSLVFCMIFCWSVLVFFWVHFLLAMVHLRFTASYYPFTIFEHLLYLVDNPHLCEKTGFQNYCDTSFFRGDVHQMWILKISKDLLEYLQSMSCSTWNSITHLTSLHITLLLLTLNKRQIKVSSSTIFH